MTASPPLSDPDLRRFAELNALAGLLPYQRRDELSAPLTDSDIATLRHLVTAGMGANTLRALASDLAYLERWHQAAVGGPLPWPASEALVMKFIAHHLFDAAKWETDPAHGMPRGVAEALWWHGQAASRPVVDNASMARPIPGQPDPTGPALGGSRSGPSAGAQEREGGDQGRD